MNDQQSMDEVLGLVEKTTGKPALVQEDATLRLPATVKIARGSAPAHVILYQPASKPELPYLASFQSGFLLRLYQASAEKRFDLASTHVGMAEATRLVQEHLRRQKKKLPDQVTRQFAEQIGNGILLQLRSVPIGMRIDSWLYDTYPTLREHQRVLAIRQLNENAAALRPDVKEMSPRKLYEANLAMNAAFAAFWSLLLGDNLLVAPYQTSGHLSSGQELLRLFDEISAAPDSDRDLIDTWGKRLGLDGWYSLKPHI